MCACVHAWLPVNEHVCMRTSMRAIVEYNVCKHYLKLSTAEIVRQIFLEIAIHNNQCYQHPHPSLLLSPLPFHVLILILALPRANQSPSLPVPCSLKRELDVFVDNKRLVFQQAPKYLGVRLDRMLNFKQHLDEVAGKVTSRGSLIRRLAGTTWGASAKTLRISTQSLVFPAAEYCAPVWSRSPHMKKVDVAINSSLRTISGCLKTTPVFQFPLLAGIAPASLRRKAATLALARKAVKHDWHILHDTTKNGVPPCRLKSRKPYNKEAHDMLSVIHEDRSKDAWIAATWKQEWEAPGPTRVHRYVSDPGTGVKGEELSRKTMDESKPTANWGRSVQSIHEEVGTGGQCGMWVWRARTDSWPHHQQLPITQKLASSKLGHWPEHGSNRPS